MEIEENSFDSLDTVQAPVVWDVIACVSTVWASLDGEVKQGWANQAIMLNSRPIPGLYKSLPTALTIPTSEYHTCHVLLSDL